MFRKVPVEGRSRPGAMNRAAREQRISITFKPPALDKHWGGVESICLHPTRPSVFTASRDASIKRWEPDQNGSGLLHCTSSLEGHCGWVTSLAFFDVAPHGLLISGSYDTTIKLWNPEFRRQELHSFREHSDYVLQLATAEHAAKFVSAGLRGDLYVWDAEVCCNIAKLGSKTDRQAAIAGGQVQAGSIYAMACTPDLRLICFSGADGQIWLYDPRAHNSIVGVLKGHRDNVRALRVSLDGTRIVSGSSDRTVRVWDVGMQACSAALEMHSDSVWALTTDDACATVISGGRDKQVFLTDVASERTELVTNVGAPVLDVQADWAARNVWVGTTLSDVTAWSFQAINEPTQPVFSHELGHSNAGEGGRKSTGRPSIPTYEPVSRRPMVNLRGTPPLVRHAVFEDKRHILTLDAAGTVALWDIVYSKHVTVYKPGTDFVSCFKELFLTMLDPVPAWFTSDVQLGVLTLHLSNPQAFTAELYATAVGLECTDDVKLNFGHEILKGVLEVWRLKCEGRSINDRAENGTAKPFDLRHSRSVRPWVSCRAGDSGVPWSLDMWEFSGHEHERGMLPKWVIDAVTIGQYAVPVSNAKLSFSLLPARDSDLPTLDRVRLTAPVILEVRKVVYYVKDRLKEQNIHVGVSEITFDPATNHRERMLSSEPLLQITCNGKLIPFGLTLNTVKRYLFTGRADEDIPLEYSCVDPNTPHSPLPRIVPKEISNH